MNRSILIIICDFLVLAAMSLSIGMSTGGDTSNPRAGTRRVSRKSAYSIMRSEVAKKDALAKENAGLSERVAELESELSAAGKETKAAADELKNESGRRAMSEAELAKLADELKKANAVIVSKERLLSEHLEKLNERERLLRASEQDLRKKEVAAAYMQGRLSATERELADARKKASDANERLIASESNLARARGELAVVKTDLQETSGRLRDVRMSLAKSSNDLAATKAKLTKTEESVAAKDKDLSFTRTRLTKAEELLRSDAITAYSGAVQEITLAVKNERIMNSFTVNETFYLPEVAFGDRVYLVGSFRPFTGLSRRYSGYTRVTQLDYFMKRPESSAKAKRLTGPMFSLDCDSRVTLMHAPEPHNRPLKAISFADLKKRGIQNLTLFKYRSFGKELADLGGRCSISLKEKDNNNYLYIRNSVRGSETAAEVGDFVIAKEGYFVGVVVSVADYDSGECQEAMCFIFPSVISTWDNAPIDIYKPADAKYYSAFTDAVEKIRKKTEDLDREHSPGSR